MGAFCASTAPSASTGPVRVGQDGSQGGGPCVMSSWTAASSDCSRPVNNYVHVKTADLYRPNARLTPERQGYQVLTPFGKLGYSQTLQQVWFCGMHTDVGGGYEQTGLSDIALEWMVQKSVACGLHFYPRDLADPKGEMEHMKCRPNADGWLHDSRSGVHRLFHRRVRNWNRPYPPTVHESVKLRRLNRSNETSSKYSPWILNGDYEVEPWRSFGNWRPDALDGWCDRVQTQPEPTR